MKVGVMQPYFFPYIGYWQLLNAVDRYVIYDDVNYINRGWINRNRILFNGNSRYFNVPLLGASQNKLINEIGVNSDEKEIKRNLSILVNCYRKAPYFSQIYPILEAVICYNTDNLSDYLGNSIFTITKYLDINTEIMFSSDLKKDNKLKGESKIIAICKELNATDYYNAVGGMVLYHNDLFFKNEINLHFVRTNSIVYKQFDNEFQPNLSIIDVMMFNSRDQVKDMLHEYTLINGELLQK